MGWILKTDKLINIKTKLCENTQNNYPDFTNNNSNSNITKL